MEEIIDTNIIIRFLVGDHPEHLKRSKEIFQEAKTGKRKIVIKPLVVAETCYVLESNYKKKGNEISEVLRKFLSQDWLIVEDRETLLGLWEWYNKNFHFVDSYLIAWAKNNGTRVISFDKKITYNLEKNN